MGTIRARGDVLYFEYRDAGGARVQQSSRLRVGQEKEARARRKAFAAYQVNATLLSAARPEAVFMHCLPAHRGEEVTDEVIESPASIVFDQAENRLHAQKALLLMMLS